MVRVYFPQTFEGNIASNTRYPPQAGTDDSGPPLGGSALVQSGTLSALVQTGTLSALIMGEEE